MQKSEFVEPVIETFSADELVVETAYTQIIRGGS